MTNKPTISLLVAATQNNVIGKDNQLLWHLPNDMRFFKNLTWAGCILMGRKTFDSIGRALPGRTNIVVTTNKDWKKKNTVPVSSLATALEAAKATNCKELFVIGGGNIYAQMLGQADKIYMTRVHATLEGDTYFPIIDEDVWKLDNAIEFQADDKHIFAYTIQTWIKK